MPHYIHLHIKAIESRHYVSISDSCCQIPLEGKLIASCLVKLTGLVGAPHQRGAGNPGKSACKGLSLVFIKLLRRDIADDGMVLVGRRKVLSQGEQLAACLSEVIHSLENLILLFAQAQHKA